MHFLKRFAVYLSAFKSKVVLVVLFHVLTAIFTVVSIPMIIPFFQILFSDQPIAVNVDTNQNIIASIEIYIQQLLVEQDKQTVLLYVCGAILVVFLFKNIFRYLAMFFMTPIRNGIIQQIRSQIYSKIQSLPLSFFKEQKKGNLLSIVSNDVQEVEWSIVNTLEAFFKSPLIIIGSIGFMLAISPKLSLFVLLLLVITIFIIGGISKTLKKKSSFAQTSLGNLLSQVEETIYGHKAMKMYEADEFFKTKFEEQNSSYKDIINRVLWRRDLSSPLSEFLGIAVVTVLLWVGSNQVFSEALSPAVFFAFIFAFYQVIEPAKSFATAYYNVQKGLGALDRIDLLLAAKVYPEYQDQVISLSGFNEAIRFNKVSFRYGNTGGKVLDEIDIEIKKGEKIALVGPSGSGKTTLTDLLLRFYIVDSGSITIDGVDINNLSLTDLRSLFSVVNQHPILFHDTVIANIAMTDDYDLERVKEAAAKANASNFITKLSDGYDTVIGAEGMKLSGGERQRICLARAIYRDAAIVILDEATSSVDAQSEMYIQEALEEVLSDKTAIIIAHKLSTVQSADKIFVLEGGKILKAGTHTELLEGDTSDHYQKIVALQTVD